MGATARLNGGVTMIGPGPDDKIYPVVKLATVLNALADEGVSMEDALAGCACPKARFLPPQRGFRSIKSSNAIVTRIGSHTTVILPITQACDSTFPHMGCTASRS